MSPFSLKEEGLKKDIDSLPPRKAAERRPPGGGGAGVTGKAK